MITYESLNDLVMDYEIIHTQVIIRKITSMCILVMYMYYVLLYSASQLQECLINLLTY